MVRHAAASGELDGDVTLSWLSVDAKTGVILADLPDLDVPKVSRSICRYDSTTATLPVPTAPEGWELATRPGGAVMILTDDSGAAFGLPPNPLWGGLVTVRPRGSSDVIPMSLATMEAYLDRRFVGDVTYTAQGRNWVAGDLVTRYVAAGPLGGIPIRVVLIGGVGALIDRTYADANDKTVYSVLNELAALTDSDPIEYTIGWEHQTSPERYTPVFYVGSRIGAAVMPGMATTATFDLPGCITDALQTEDYSAGRGANDVMAVSTPLSTGRPQSAHHLAPDDGRPTYEHRYTPSSGISEIPTLDDHAAATLAALKDGATALALSASVMASSTKPAAPVLGTDWNLGDDIGYEIGGLEADPRKHMVDVYADTFVDTWVDQFFPTGTAMVLVNPDGRPSVPAFPNGLNGTQRAIGWEMTLGVTPVVTPILIGA